MATRHAGIPDAVVHAEHGFLVNEGDVDSMADYMMRLAEDSNLADQMGTAFRQRVSSHYSREISVSRLQNILDRAAGKVVASGHGYTPNETGEGLQSRTEKVNNVYAEPVQAVAAIEPEEDFQKEAALLVAIGLDRNDSAAYEEYTRLLMRQKRYKESLIAINEALRTSDRSHHLKPLFDQLDRNPEAKSQEYEVYRYRTGVFPPGDAPRKFRILVFTNLLPPQEMGGYGRTIWEFCDLLLKRGHEVKLLTADMPKLCRSPEPGHDRMERYISRDLKLYGDWRDGRVWIEKDKEKLEKICTHNYQCILKEVAAFQPDVCMAGNLDLIGHAFLNPILERNILIIHRLGNKSPGYSQKSAPTSKLYCLCGCSQWTNAQVRAEKLPIRKYPILPPGAPIEEYYRAFSPHLDRLRICFVGLMLPYKGSQILIQALVRLKQLNIHFSCEFAGDTTDSEFVDDLKQQAKESCIENQIRFLGYLNRKELSSLYARSNVLVFPSVFEEPFGKSIIEAQAAGLCVVCSGTGGTTEIIEDNVNGLLFKNRDAEDLAHQLSRLHADKKMWERLSIQGQKNAYQFTTLKSILKLESLFAELLDSVQQA